MNFGFRSKAKAFFVDIDSSSYLLGEPGNVILSPSMYWGKRVNLPVQIRREEKSLILSQFKENLPEGKYSTSTNTYVTTYLIFDYN